MEINISAIPKSTNSAFDNERKDIENVGYGHETIKIPEVQLLPCNINYDGKANVDKYFIIDKLRDEQKKKGLTDTTDDTTDGTSFIYIYCTSQFIAFYLIHNIYFTYNNNN